MIILDIPTLKVYKIYTAWSISQTIPSSISQFQRFTFHRYSDLFYLLLKISYEDFIPPKYR